MRVGLLMTAIFGNLSGYFFGRVRHKASNIIYRYATPLSACALNDLYGFEWLFHIKLGFCTSHFRPSGFTFKDNCVKSNKRRQILSVAKI